MRCLLIGLATLLCTGAASACNLHVILSAQWAALRLAGFSLRVQHASISELRVLPVGWRLVIDNDPSWNTSAEGHAIVGAAFLPSSAISNLIAVTPQPSYACSDLLKSDGLRLSIKFYIKDQLKVFAVPISAISVGD